MDIGKPIKIHNIPAPQEPKRIPIRENPYYAPIRIQPKREEPIPVPDWPVKVPEKVEA